MPQVCEQHGELAQKVDYIVERVTDIKSCLTGNLAEGKPGLIALVTVHNRLIEEITTKDVVAKVEKNSKFVAQVEKDRHDVGTWLFRGMLTIILGYIAYKVGFVPH